MSASIDKGSPELSGLFAANSGFSLVEKAVTPASRRRGAASFWFTAAISLASLAAAAGMTVAGDPPAVAELQELPGAAAPVVTVAAAAAVSGPASGSVATSGAAIAPAVDERAARAKIRACCPSCCAASPRRPVSAPSRRTAPREPGSLPQAGRMALVPVGRLLIGPADAERRRLVIAAADDLQRQRQTRRA